MAARATVAPAISASLATSIAATVTAAIATTFATATLTTATLAAAFATALPAGPRTTATATLAATLAAAARAVRTACSKCPRSQHSHVATHRFQKPARSRSAAHLGPRGEPSPPGGRRGPTLWLALGCLRHSRRMQWLSSTIHLLYHPGTCSSIGAQARAWASAMPSCGCRGRLRARAGHAALSRQAKWMSE